MKLLFKDYSNEISTESMYLNQALVQCGIDSKLWNDPRVSVFDALDSVAPDVLVTSTEMLNMDIIKYIKKHKNISLVLNISALSERHYSYISDLSLDINIPFVFSNYGGVHKPKPKLKKGEYHHVLPAYDIFNSQTQQLKFGKMKEAIVARYLSENLQQMISHENKNKKEVYHLVQLTKGDMSEHFDIRADAMSAVNLYGLYDLVTIVGDVDFCTSQVFFDASVYSDRVAIKSDDRDRFNMFVSDVFVDMEVDEDTSPLELMQHVKKQIKSRHTPYHRAATLMKLLKDKESLAKVETVKSKVLGEIK